MRLAQTGMLIVYAALQSASMASPTTTAESQVTVKPLGTDQYELTFTSGIPDFANAQRALLPRAKELCGDKQPTFGRYSFEMNQPLTDSQSKSAASLRLTQALHCGAATPSPVSQTSPKPEGWQPTADDQATVERQTYRYLNSKVTGDYVSAYAMFTDSMKDATHFDSWQTSVQSFNARAGQLLKRKIRKITWYKDPPSAPLPGIYVAADYASEFSDVPIHCGYVAWYRTPNGDYQIIHEVENSIAKASIAQMKPSEVAVLAAKFGCT